MRNTSAGGDGNGFGIMLAVVLAILGVAVFASNVGFHRVIYLFKHAL
jgi:hypothetical protein